MTSTTRPSGTICLPGSVVGVTQRTTTKSTLEVPYSTDREKGLALPDTVIRIGSHHDEKVVEKEVDERRTGVLSPKTRRPKH